MNDSYIKVENLCYSYHEDDGRDVPVLNNVSFDIKKGEYVAILGHNGSGKSTLAKLLDMILTPTSGKITVAGVDITSPELTEDDMYVTGSESFWNSFRDIYDEMENESDEWSLKLYRLPSKNRQGKDFLTCSII